MLFHSFPRLFVFKYIIFFLLNWKFEFSFYDHFVLIIVNTKNVIFNKTTYLYIQARFHSIFRSPSTFAVNFRSFAGNPYCKRTVQSHLQTYLYLLTCYLGAFQDQGSIFLKRFILKIRMYIKKFYTLFRLHFILILLKYDIYHNLKILSVVSSLYYFKTVSHYNVYKYKKKKSNWLFYVVL